MSTNKVVWVVMSFSGLAMAVAVMLGTRREQLPGIPELIRTGAIGLDGATVFEHRGVQFALVLPAQNSTVVGGVFEAVLFVQNCLDMPRTLAVHLRGKTDAITSPLRREFSLSPGVVAQLRVPWAIQSSGPGSVNLELAVLTVGNATGSRLRSFRGASYDSSSDVLTTNLLGAASLLATGVGTFSVGSPSQFSLRLEEGPQGAPRERPPSVRVIYSPSKERLAASVQRFSLPT
jgi:hypothetical protein